MARKSAAERFWSKVNKEGPVPSYAPDLGPCWLWTRATGAEEYGVFRVDGRLVYAHRWAYADCVKPIPNGMQLDHLCRVHSCVNPTHLEVETQRVNILRGTSPSARHARRAKCPAGHDYDHVEMKAGRVRARRCLTCRRAQARARYAARVGAA